MIKKMSDYSIKELRAICQASAPNPARESYVGRFSRIFSIYCTKFFLRTSLTPNWITAISVLVFFAGISLTLFNDYWLTVAGAIIVFFSVVLDGCDGEVARFRKQTGVVGGMYTEPVSHDIQYGLMFLIIAAAVYLGGGSPLYFVAAALAGITKLEYRLLELRFWMTIKDNEAAREVQRVKAEHGSKPAWLRLAYWVHKEFFSSTGVCLAFFVFAVLGKMEWYIMTFAAGYTLFWLLLFFKQVRTLRAI